MTPTGGRRIPATVRHACPACLRVTETLAACVTLLCATQQYVAWCGHCARPVVRDADRATMALLLAGGVERVSRRNCDDVIADETLEALIWPDGDAPVWPVTEDAS